MSNEEQNKPTPEIKEFQEKPSLELVDKIYTLGRVAIYEFGEQSLGEFLIQLAFQYASRIYELQQRTIKLAAAKQLHELTEKYKENAESNTEEEETDPINDIPEGELKEVFKDRKVH